MPSAAAARADLPRRRALRDEIPSCPARRDNIDARFRFRRFRPWLWVHVTIKRAAAAGGGIHHSVAVP